MNWNEFRGECLSFLVCLKGIKNRKPCKQVNSWGPRIMMPCLSASFLTYKLPSRPPPQWTQRVVYCVATFWYYFSKGKPTARNEGTRENTCYLQCCCHWERPQSPWCSSRVCHRDRRPGDNTARQQRSERASPGILTHSFSYPLIFLLLIAFANVTNQDAGVELFPAHSAKIESRPFDMWSEVLEKDAASAMSGCVMETLGSILCRGGCQSQKWDPVTDVIKYSKLWIVQLESVPALLGYSHSKEALWTRAVNFLLPRLHTLRPNPVYIQLPSANPHCENKPKLCFAAMLSLISACHSRNWVIKV